jgi:hypothetical protein
MEVEPAKMASDSCSPAVRAPDPCECCSKDGKKNVIKFGWTLLGTQVTTSMTGRTIMSPVLRHGYFCTEGHFWESQKYRGVPPGGGVGGGNRIPHEEGPIDYDEDIESQMKQPVTE